MTRNKKFERKIRGELQSDLSAGPRGGRRTDRKSGARRAGGGS